MTKKYNKKITFEVATKRFVQQGRMDIKLCIDGFNGWKKKSKFYDNIINDYFWAIPKNVYTQNSSHPKRAADSRKRTNIKKYGNACSLHGNTKEAKKVQKKVEKTNIRKFGVVNPFQSDKIKTKIKQTNFEKYGVENPSQAEEIKKKKKKAILKRFGVAHQMHSSQVIEKCKQTNIKKYGVSHPSKNEKIKEKKKETCKTLYGVKSPFQLPGVKEKAKRTMKEKYGSETYWGSIKITIKNSDLSLLDWWSELPEPKPSYSNLCLQINKENPVRIDRLEQILNDYNQNKTTLELSTEQLLEIKHYNRKPKQLKTNYRPDFKLSPQIFLNVDGLYWHSDNQKDKKYHFNLRKEFEESGLRILQFREDEIRNKPSIVKSIVDNTIGKTKNKIYARKCKTKQVQQKEATKFLKDNHLMGSTNAKHIGLYFNENLVSILSYKQRKNVCKIERFCSLNNHVVVGGFSKLLKYLEQNCLNPNITEIHNWVDLRYGTGKHLKSKGFTQIKDTLGWKWTDGENTFNRLKCRANMDERKLTEAQHAEEKEWHRIYDAGQRLYIKHI